MIRILPSAVAFSLGFAVSSALVLSGTSEPASVNGPSVLSDAAPWTQHRASPLLAQESLEMRNLRNSNRLAQLDMNKVRGPH